MDILFASSNEHKKQELQELLKPHKLHLPKEFNISFDCEETGTTFLENAMQKAQALQKQAGKIDMPIIADDSGMIVDALPGELGVRTARFGSKDGKTLLSPEEKNKLLLERLKDCTNRSARFISALVFLYKGKAITAEGVAEGRILTSIHNGTGGFGYDPVFFSNEANGCFAELGTEQKNIYSHRAKAAASLLEQLSSNSTPSREEIKESDKWDLSLLCKSEKDFEDKLLHLRSEITKITALKGKLKDSIDNLLKALKWLEETGISAETLGNYAYLNYSTQVDNPSYQKMVGLYTQAATELSAASSFINPEILSIPDIENLIKQPQFDNYRVSLNKLLREKAHVLSDKEESILAMQSELQNSPSDVFEALTNSDMDFGKIDNKALTQSTFSFFMKNPDRDIRKKAYLQFYESFAKHEQTLTKLYASSVKQDIFNAKVRGFSSSLEASLYPDNIPKDVYLNLIESVHKALPILHRYYALKKEICHLDELRHYDVYLPMAENIEIKTPYSEACNLIKKALSPLGEEYTTTLYKGLTSEHWADIYENKGKRSGAFSSGGYIGNPYILLNYNENLLNDVFTVAHEGGHSMHTYYSKLNNPFSCYNYTIFVAEVASTFNEQMLADYLINNAENDEIRKYIISKELDDIVATLFRQTMFAEFELLCHSQQENGQILTSESIRENYRNLLEQYFGPEMHFESCSDLECLRIPHFYNAFYVYKYATGISAAIALSQQVLYDTDRQSSTKSYLNFLTSGGSKFPMESLKLAGVDMSSPKPVDDAIAKFAKLLDQRSKML